MFLSCLYKNRFTGLLRLFRQNLACGVAISASGSRESLPSPHLRNLWQFASSISAWIGLLVIPSIFGTKTHILPKTEAKPNRFLEKVVQNLYTEFRGKNSDRGGYQICQAKIFRKNEIKKRAVFRPSETSYQTFNIPRLQNILLFVCMF